MFCVSGPAFDRILQGKVAEDVDRLFRTMLFNHAKRKADVSNRNRLLAEAAEAKKKGSKELTSLRQRRAVGAMRGDERSALLASVLPSPRQKASDLS